MVATTTSRTGNAGGFTLLEILLALAVIGLLAAVLIGGSARLLAGREATPDEVFWDAVRTTRKYALDRDHQFQLSWDDKAKDFTITDGEAANADGTPIVIQTIPVPNLPPEFGATFVPANTTASEELVAGVLTATQSMAFVTFYEDGTCVPFRVQLHSSLGSHFLSIDPWTCAQVLTPLNPDGTPRTNS